MATEEQLAKRRYNLTLTWGILSATCFILSMVFFSLSKRRLPKIEKWLNKPSPNEAPSPLPTKLALQATGFAVILFLTLVTVAFVVVLICFKQAKEKCNRLTGCIYSVCKAILSIHLPVAAVVGASFAKDDIFMMFFLIVYCYHILFSLLMLELTDDFGIIDFLVAIALGGIAVSRTAVWKLVFIALAVGLKSFLPYLVREWCLSENSGFRDIDPLLRRSNTSTGQGAGGQPAGEAGGQPAGEAAA